MKEVVSPDPKALREKYAVERAKRLRPEGLGQYRELKGDPLLDDTFTDGEIRRAAVLEDVDVLIIGGGFGGMLAGAYLRDAGIGRIRIIEKGGDFGGTWYWNRYPGAACDIESYIYLPLLEEVGYMPKEKYSKAPEIFEYCKLFAKKFDLYESALFRTEVIEVRWSDDRRLWVVKTNRGDEISAQFVCMANGLLQRPKLPNIEGIELFKGKMFHTSRWDYSYTGGDQNGNLTKLKDKRVGVVGTGATAIQCVPSLANSVEHLYVFQRTPSSVDVRNNFPTDPAWVNSLTPGWQRRRMDNFNAVTHGRHPGVDLVNDGWTNALSQVVAVEPREYVGNEEKEQHAKLLQIANIRKMEEIRSRVSEIVEDSRTAEALKPYYDFFCKRPCFHDEYLAAFNLPNVSLVDTDGKGIERIGETSVHAGGAEYELDCLIFATGFEVGTSFTHRAGYEVYGRGGVRLTDKWVNGVATLHGMHTHDFPNCFILSIVQAGITPSYTHVLDEQAMHLSYIIKHCRDNDVREVEVLKSTEDEWVNTIRSLGADRIKFEEQCTPSYGNNEGKVDNLVLQNGSYGGGALAYLEILKNWRDQGELKGMALFR